MDNRVRLKILGLSYSQLQTGAYALLLAEVNGPRRIPVVIGAAEAQSIAIKLEGISPMRPLTHDLFVSFTHAFGVALLDVFIYKFEDGIFSSELTFTDGTRQVVIDSRTSDAIAIAIRSKAPIYTTEEILRETGFVIEEIEHPGNKQGESIEQLVDEISDFFSSEPKIENFTIEELERTLQHYIEIEDYEQAARVSEILKKKKSEDNQSDSGSQNE